MSTRWQPLPVPDDAHLEVELLHARTAVKPEARIGGTRLTGQAL